MYRSLYKPPRTAGGAEPPTPTKNRKISKAGQLVVRAQARVNSVKIAKEEMKQILLPNNSLIGPNTMGPKIQPTRNMATGSVACRLLVTPKALSTLLMAPLGRLELTFTLRFNKRPMTTTNHFFFYKIVRRLRSNVARSRPQTVDQFSADAWYLRSRKRADGADMFLLLVH